MKYIIECFFDRLMYGCEIEFGRCRLDNVQERYEEWFFRWRKENKKKSRVSFHDGNSILTKMRTGNKTWLDSISIITVAIVVFDFLK